jgi:hypothetical protein
VSDIPASLQAKIDKLQDEIDGLRSPAMAKFAKNVDAVAARHADIVHLVSFWAIPCPMACIYVHLETVAAATEILRDVRRAFGLKLESREDEPAASKIVWTFGAVTVYATLTGAACKFVQVGTKQVPVYEVRCEGADTAEV